MNVLRATRAHVLPYCQSEVHTCNKNLNYLICTKACCKCSNETTMQRYQSAAVPPPRLMGPPPTTTQRVPPPTLVSRLPPPLPIPPATCGLPLIYVYVMALLICISGVPCNQPHLAGWMYIVFTLPTITQLSRCPFAEHMCDCTCLFSWLTVPVCPWALFSRLLGATDCP